MEACLSRLQSEHLYRLRFDFVRYPVVWIQGDFARLCVHEGETYIWRLQCVHKTDGLINHLLSGTDVEVLGRHIIE